MAYGKSNRPLLAVLDRDEVFSWKLAEYMNARSSFPFEAAAFTKPDRFLAFLEEQEVGVLLMDEDLLYEQSDEHFADKAARAVPICLLLEGSRREGPVEAESPYRVLGRYRAADVLIDEILQICAEAGEALVVNLPLEDWRAKAQGRERWERVSPGAFVRAVETFVRAPEAFVKVAGPDPGSPCGSCRKGAS